MDITYLLSLLISTVIAGLFALLNKMLKRLDIVESDVRQLRRDADRHRDGKTLLLVAYNVLLIQAQSVISAFRGHLSEHGQTESSEPANKTMAAIDGRLTGEEILAQLDAAKGYNEAPAVIIEPVGVWPKLWARIKERFPFLS